MDDEMKEMLAEVFNEGAIEEFKNQFEGNEESREFEVTVKFSRNCLSVEYNVEALK